VAVLNQTLVRTFFGNHDPIGRKINFNLLDELCDAAHDAYFEIIGVVSDTRNRGLQDPPMAHATIPYTITAMSRPGILLRTAVKPASVLSSVRREIASLDSNIALSNSEPLEDAMQRDFFAQPESSLKWLSVFAAIGLLLVAIGVFSVTAYSVSLRAHEIVVRIALGAQRSDVLRMVLKSGLSLIATGITIGVLASVGLTRFLANQIWGVSPTHPWMFFAAVAVVLAAGRAACLFPARRATRVDPLIALRYE
jgi:putative ABC transport system permease protein